MVLWGTAVLVFLMDRGLKIWAQQVLATAPDGLPGLAGIFRFYYVENTGMAFGLFAQHTWALALFTVLAGIIAYLFIRPYRLGLWPKLTIGIIVGGAIGNLFDRILYGYVIDMVDLIFMRFAVFNLADAAITVGGVFLAISILFRPKDFVQRTSSHNVEKEKS